jgi:hypothetical protein
MAESQTAYDAAGVQDTFLGQLCGQAGLQGCPNEALGYIFANVPAVSGPNCRAGNCGVDQHLHVADACVAKGLAGLSGGCN